MKYLVWLLKAAIFFTLFAFALGLLVGALGMVPRWWKHRTEALRARRAAPQSAETGVGPLHGL
jgi:hypothetical protein